MASTFEDTVFDFDLNFLRQTPNNTNVQNKVDKQRKAILLVKKKTIATDSLIRKYYAKKELLDQTEKVLISSKEECKQICIDYKNALEMCSKLEMDAQTLQTTNQELEEKATSAENQCQAIQSYSNQLQVLLKDYVSNIEGLKIENELQKSSAKNYEKKIESLKKDNAILTKHIGIILDVLYNKKTVNNNIKKLFEKYKKLINNDSEETMFEGSVCKSSDDETITSPCAEMSPAYVKEDYLESNNEMIHRSSTTDKQDGCNRMGKCDRDVDGNQEVVSVDTGRGSSLAFSDSDKCFHSPDYFMDDSPLSAEILTDKANAKMIDAATSPITVHEAVNIGTSPILPEQYKSSKVMPHLNDFHVCTHTKKSLIDKAVSPIISNTTIDMSTSPIRTCFNETVLRPINNSCNMIRKENCDTNIPEIECFELNDSNSSLENDSNDNEIEMILSNMRLSHKLVTPIPNSPVKSHTTEVIPLATPFNTQNEHTTCGCQDAAKIREENKILHASIADLTKEVMSIKSLLKTQLLNGENRGNKQMDVLINDKSFVTSFMSDVNGTHMSKVNESHISDINDNVMANVNSSFIPCEISFRQSSPETELFENMQCDSPLLNEELTIDQSFDNSLDKISEKENNSPIVPANTTLQMNTINKLIFEEEQDSIMAKDNIENKGESEDSTQNSKNITENLKNKPKVKKLTRLEKFKKKMLPKSKIQRIKTPPISKLRVKPKPIRGSKKKVDTFDTSASLNDKDIYEKAVKVMAELNSNRKVAKNVSNLREKTKFTPSSNKVIKVPKEDSKQTDNNSRDLLDELITPTLTRSITTRSQSKNLLKGDEGEVQERQKSVKVNRVNDENKAGQNRNICSISPQDRKRLKRVSLDQPEIDNKRLLRSSVGRQSITNSCTIRKDSQQLVEVSNKLESSPKQSLPVVDASICKDNGKKVIDYNDLDLFCDGTSLNNNQVCQEKSLLNKRQEKTVEKNVNNLQDYAFCKILDKYGVTIVKTSPKSTPDSVINSACTKIEEGISKIAVLSPHEAKDAMNKLVDDIRNWNMKHFLLGLIKYLKNPSRKTELFNKVCSPPAPPMTKSEQILLYVVTQLQGYWPGVDIVECVLNNIEYSLFKLNRTPEFDTVESMSHFYAVLCRYIKAKSRLRLFILDAMYCIQFKAVPLIKQCLDVWMHILPLAHMGIAKTPLVTCLVYLLHFFKCEDKFNRVNEIRNILSQKFFYNISEWTETKILDMFRNSIKEIRDISIEKKILRMALIILSKRKGPRWCQANIIKNILQPLIEKETAPERVRVFCVSVIGPLLKPYPVDMKVHCEIVMNQLVDMLNQSPSQSMQEAIITSLIYMCKHNQNRVIQVLLTWNPKCISAEMEDLLRDFVREKPLRVWKAILSRVILFR